MRIRRYIVIVCTVALTVGSMLAEGLVLHRGADVNHDGWLDILDAQAIASQLAATPLTQPGCDVNDDGAVDIRDFQRAIAGLSEPIQLPPPITSGANRPQACLVLKDGVSLPLLPCRVVWAGYAGESPGKRRALEQSSLLVASVQHTTRRFLFSLTPHAPPCFV